MKQQIPFIILNYNAVIVPIIVGTLILKVALFVKFKPVKWKYYNLVYFSTGQIVSAKSEYRVNIKIIENALSYYLVFLLVLECLFYFFTSK